MSAVLAVILGVVIPFVVMFAGFVIMIKSRNNETMRSVIAGVVLAVLGGVLLLAVSIFLVHELTVYAPYFQR